MEYLSTVLLAPTSHNPPPDNAFFHPHFDWHLGHVYRKLGARAAESAQWRLDAAQRVFDLAIEKKVDFVLVAGDVFDTNTPAPDIMQAAVEILRDAPVPTYLISGNHDPLAEGSVWNNPIFADALKTAQHSHSPQKTKPCKSIMATPFYSCVRLPRATRAKMPQAGFRARHAAKARRASRSHGGWKGYWQSGEYCQSELNAIDNTTTDRCGLDYLALGDYHSFTPKITTPRGRELTIPARPKSPRTTTPAQATRCGCRLKSRAQIPSSRPARRVACNATTGAKLCCNQAMELRFCKLNSVRLQIAMSLWCARKFTGCVAQNEWRELNAWLSELRETVLGADVDVSRLLTEPTHEDFWR